MDMYEYKTVRNVNHYEADGAIDPEHKFNYIKRRNRQFDSKYTGFKPYCSCKWKSTIWWPVLKQAILEHYKHVEQFHTTHPKLGPA